MKYLHTMVRVSDLEASLAFYGLLGLREIRRMDHEAGRFTLIFLAAPGDEEAQVELTFNWDPEVYTGDRRPAAGRCRSTPEPNPLQYWFVGLVVLVLGLRSTAYLRTISAKGASAPRRKEPGHATI